MTEDVESKRLESAAPALSVVGVVGAIISAALGTVGAGLALLAFVYCTATYRGFLLERNDPPLDCLAQPEWRLVWWFLLVGLGAALSFSCLIVGARPSWDARGHRRLARGLVWFLGLAAVTAVSAVVTWPLG